MWWTELSTEEDKMIKEERESLTEKAEEWIYDSGPMKTPSEYGWKEELRQQKRDQLASKAEEWEQQNYAEIETGLKAGGGLTSEDVTYDAYDAEGDFTFYTDQANQMLAEFTGDRHFVLYNDEGEMLIDCNLSDGETIFGPNYTPDEATRVFWETIGKVGEEAEPADPADYEAMYNKTSEILRDVRHSLGVPEGENIVEYAKMSAPAGIADDMPEEYLTEYVTMKQDIEFSEEQNRQFIKDFHGFTDEQIDSIENKQNFDDSMKGLIDG